jgi:hypothetical protein
MGDPPQKLLGESVKLPFVSYKGNVEFQVICGCGLALHLRAAIVGPGAKNNLYCHRCDRLFSITMPQVVATPCDPPDDPDDMLNASDYRYHRLGGRNEAHQPAT